MLLALESQPMIITCKSYFYYKMLCLILEEYFAQNKQVKKTTIAFISVLHLCLCNRMHTRRAPRISMCQ